MKETINAIGTVLTIVCLVVGMMFVPTFFAKALMGISIIYVIYFHDEILKAIWRQGEVDKYNREVDAFNAEVEEYNREE